MIRRSSIDFHYYNKNLYLDGFNETMHRVLYYAKLNDIVICNLIESGKLSLDDYNTEVAKVQTELEEGKNYEDLLDNYRRNGKDKS